MDPYSDALLKHADALNTSRTYIINFWNVRIAKLFDARSLERLRGLL